MASKKSLNAKNLEVLGADRLAELLVEIGAGNAEIKRRLRLELAGAAGPAEVAREVRKRLAAIGRSRSFVDWQNRKALVQDLETQRRAIVEQVAKTDPGEAMELMWRFLGLANSVFARCDDSSGTVIGIFHSACNNLGEITIAANGAPDVLTQHTFAALQENHYGQYDGLIEILTPALGRKGLDHLKALFVQLLQAPKEKPVQAEREVIGYGSSDPLYADELAARHRESTTRLALQNIADAQGDVDAFIAQQSGKAKTVPAIAAEITQRLLTAGRVEEGWEAIEAADTKRGWIPFEWEQTRLDVLEALGRHEEAQTFRWECFERSLDERHLRGHLKRLPDFDDVEAEERALEVAVGFPNVHQALAFLVKWPAQEKAAQLVFRRVDELDGNYYEVLTPAADTLEAKHPLAATILRRAMIDFTLAAARSKRYRHAVRHLRECASLSGSIEDFGRYDSHQAYLTRLKADHGRKTAFWALLPPECNVS